MKNAVKERNVLHSDVKKSKSILEVNISLDIDSPHSKIVSEHQIIKSGIHSNSTDSNSNFFAFEHKKPTVAEVVEQRFLECSKNILLVKDTAISHQKEYKHLEKKSKSLENMGYFENESHQINCFLSAKQKKQAVFIFSDEEEEDCIAEFDKASKKKRLISLLEKLCFVISKKNKENLSKFCKPGNSNWAVGKFSQDI